MQTSFQTCILGLALALSMAPEVALARTQCDRAARVCVDVPDGWVATTQGETLVLAAPDRSLALELRAVTQLAQLGQARIDFERELAGRFLNLQWDGEPRAIQQNGMAGMGRRGRGQFPSGEPMRFFMLGLAHPTGGIVALGVISQRNREANAPILDAILSSIRPMPAR